MNAEIITIGDELLIGQVLDTNSAKIAVCLNQLGLQVRRIVSVADCSENILCALNGIDTSTGLVIATGGLGPTPDDTTKQALCSFFDTKLVLNEQVLTHIKALLAKKGLFMNESNRLQAYLPVSAQILHNDIGTAPGQVFQKNNILFIFLPGVPFEMEWMLENRVVTFLKNHFSLPPVIHKTVLTSGAFEAQLAELLKDFEKELPSSYSLAYLPSPGIIRLRLSCYKSTNKISMEMDELIQRLKTFIPEFFIGAGIHSLEEYCGLLLKENSNTVSTAESCTGGSISSLLTSVPGSSAYFMGSVVAYSNTIKQDILKVDAKTIAEHGAVSREVAEKMAVNGRKLFNTHYCISTSGIAGPDGGTPSKPVGTVWICVASPGEVITRKFLFNDNRERNIRRASFAALNILRKMIESEREKI